MYDAISPWSALRQTLHLRFHPIATAIVLSTLSLSRGPLFQRSLILPNTSPSIYAINIPFLILGLLASLLTPIGIVPLYYGYWDLGRQFTLNPLEIARAFGAPMFDGVDGNASARDVEMERGDMKVRYGAVERYAGEKVLRVGDAGRVSVRECWEGEVFG
jgi:hypothetical protein